MISLNDYPEQGATRNRTYQVQNRTFPPKTGEVNPMPRWKHPGGKLREEGPDSLTDQKLLAILISAGIKGKPAEKISEEVLQTFGSLQGLANLPFERLL